jgi:hypothetical protein
MPVAGSKGKKLSDSVRTSGAATSGSGLVAQHARVLRRPGERDAIALVDLRQSGVGQRHLHEADVGGHLEQPVVAEKGARLDRAAEQGAIRGHEADLLRAHHVVDGADVRPVAGRQAVRADLHRRLAAFAPADEDVRLAEEGRGEAAVRLLVHLVGLADLLDAAEVHQHHAVRQRHRLFLVVRDHDRGDADVVLQRAQFDLHLVAQLGVERAERLVEQQHRRLDHQRAGQRHALALAAGQLTRIALGQRLEVHQRERLVDARLALAALDLAHLEAEADVLGHRHVRKQRVALEHDAQAAPARLLLRDVLAVEADRSGGRRDEARDHLQHRRLAAAGRPEQRDVLAALDGEVEVLHGDHAVVALGQPAKHEKAHRTPLWCEAAGAQGAARPAGSGRGRERAAGGSALAAQRSIVRFQRLVHSARDGLITL